MIGCSQACHLIRSSAELQPVYSIVIGCFQLSSMTSYSFKCRIAASVLTCDWLFSSMESYSFKCRIAAGEFTCEWLFSIMGSYSFKCRISASVLTSYSLFSTFKHGIIMQTSVLTRVLYIRQTFGINPSLFSLDLGFPVCVRPYRSRHAMDKPYLCETDGCGKSYYQRSHLQRHVKEKHHIVDVDDMSKTSIKPDWCVALKGIQSGENSKLLLQPISIQICSTKLEAPRKKNDLTLEGEIK